MFTQKPRLAALSSAILVSLSSQSFAADETMVVTASGFEQSQADAAASISVITREDLEKKYYRDVTDALRDVPGVTITDGGDGTDISMRGMGSAYTLILVDGKRQNSRQTRPNSDGPGIEHGWLPPLEAIERIEVVRGPMSTLYGSEAMGGVINVITRKVSKEWSGNVSVDAIIQESNESGNQYGSNFYLNGPLIDDKLGLQLYGQYVQRDEDEIIDGYEDKSIQSLTSKFNYRLNDSNDLIFEAGINEQNRSGTVGKTIEHEFNDAGVDEAEDSENNYRRSHYSLTHQGQYGFGMSDSYVQYERTDNDTRDMTIENTVAKSTWTLPLNAHFLTVGGEYKYEKLTDEGNQNPNSDLSKIDSSAGALFIEDEWAITDTFAVTSGVRFDYDEDYEEHFSPRIYGVWHTTEELTIKGGVSTGFKAPDLRAKTPNWVQVSRGGNIYGNEDLEPEKSINYEIGALFNNDYGINTGVTVFYNEFDDKITRVACPTDVCTDGVNDYGSDPTYRVNVDEAITKGVEVTFEAPITETISMNSSYSYTYSEQKSGEYKGEPLNQIPEHLANLGLDWQVNEKTSTWGKVTYRGEESQPTTGPSSDSLIAPDYTFVDMGINYKVNQNTKLKAAVYNLFDDEITADEYGYVEDGRRYWVGLDVNF